MAAVDNLRDKWESISARERTLVVLLGASAVVVLVLFVALRIRDRLNVLETRNAQARSALHKLTSYRATARTTAGLGDPTAAIGPEPIKLDSYILNAGTTAKVVVPEVTPRTPTPRGKYLVHSDMVSLRDLSLTQVKDFLQALESDSRVVMVTSLQIKRNFRDQEKMDLSAEISTWSRPPETAGAASGSGSGSGSAKGSGGG
jgi:hypothetical protein